MSAREYLVRTMLYSRSNSSFRNRPLLELANYHVLGRIFYYVPYHATLPASKVLSIFGALIAIVELLNGLGVSLASNPGSKASTQELGSHLTIAAVAIQLLVISIFIVLSAIFHHRCARSNVQSKAIPTIPNVLYVSMFLIFGRTIYRLVEHTGNTSVDVDDIEVLEGLSPLLRYEVFFYIFEATFMLINSALWNIWNPCRFLPANIHTHLAKDGKTEVQSQEQPDDRSLLMKLISVLTFGMLFRKKENQHFQELVDYPSTAREA